MDNDEGSYSYARELARRAIEDNTEIEYAEIEGEDDTHTLDRDGAIADLAEALKDWHEEAMPDLAGFAADIFGWAMAYVDWRHIAEHRIDDEAGS